MLKWGETMRTETERCTCFSRATRDVVSLRRPTRKQFGAAPDGAIGRCQPVNLLKVERCMRDGIGVGRILRVVVKHTTSKSPGSNVHWSTATFRELGATRSLTIALRKSSQTSIREDMGHPVWLGCASGAVGGRTLTVPRW